MEQQEYYAKLEPFINEYWGNDARKLRKVIDKIFCAKHGGILDRDMDEFYSVANDVIMDIISHQRYDESKGDFGGFLYRSLELAIIDELKRQNRDKRVQKIEVEVEENGKKIKKKMIVKDISLDAPTKENDKITFGETLKSDFDLEKEVFYENNDYMYSEKTCRYLNRLSKLQRKVLQCIIAGFETKEILDMLCITTKEFEDCHKAIYSYRNVSVLL